MSIMQENTNCAVHSVRIDLIAAKRHFGGLGREGNFVFWLSCDIGMKIIACALPPRISIKGHIGIFPYSFFDVSQC